VNYSTAVFLFKQNVRAVLAIYESDADKANPPRTMFKTFDKTLAIGEFVIVPTSTRHGMTVVRIVDVDVEVDFDSAAVVNWIIGRVDRTDYDKTVAMEAQAIKQIRDAEAKKKRDALRDSLLANSVGDLAALSFSPEADAVSTSPKMRW
jgi:hypothetical protein